MRSSSLALLAAFALLLATERSGSADPAPVPAFGFGVERLYPSAPGAGWFVMDALDMHGALGGVIAITGSYANEPLRIASADGSQRVPVVSSEASALLAAAVTYDRFRLSFTLDRLFVVTGRGATIGGYKYTAPNIDPGTSPDGFADSRLGLEARLLGRATSAFRLGLGAQVFIPSGDRDDYFTDATWRAMGRVLFAGDVGHFTYAGQLGFHLRPLNDEPAPGSPRGSELLYGVAGGVKLPIARAKDVFIVGPELFGETAVRDFFDRQTSDLEGLLSARLEPLHGVPDTAQLRFKLGVGAGLDAHFGAAQWRAVASVELFAFGNAGDSE